MSRLVGYDPVRIYILRRRTAEVVDELRRIGCVDPAGVEANTAVARTLATLTELWLPLLDRIAASAAMTGWAALGPHGGRLVGPHRGRWDLFVPPDERLLANLREMDDDELLDFLVAQSRRWQPLAGPGPDLDDEHVRAMLAAIGRVLDERLETQPGIGDELTSRAGQAPVIALALGYSLHRRQVITGVAGAMLAAHPSTAGFHPHTFLPGLSALLDEIATDPDACLELLRNTQALQGLAGRHDLDVDLVRTITRRGLLDAVRDDRSRLGDGYAVLRELTVLANGDLDAGFAPGLARGVGDAFIGYADTLAPAISDISERMIVPEAGEGFELGSYADVLDLLGAVAVDPVGQAGLGVALGAQLDAAYERIAEELGSGPITRSRLTPVARLARAVDEAIVAEGAEAQAATAAQAARQRRLGTQVGFVAGVVGQAIGGPAGLLVSVIDGASELLPPTGDPRQPQVVDQDVAGTFVREATFGMLALLVRDPRARAGHRLERVAGATWKRVEERIAEVEAAPVEERERAIVALDREVRRDVPALDAAVAAEIDLAGIDDVRRDRGTGDAAG